MLVAMDTLPVVGLGTWQTFDVGPAHYSARQQVLAEFVRLGGRVIDSSPMYGRAETVVGALRGEADPAGRLFLATKVWTNGRAAGLRQLEESFRRLRSDRVDLLQVHNLVDVGTHLETLREFKAQGRVRFIGITHYAASAHRAVARVLETEAVDSLQINYSAAEPEAEERLLPMAKERGIAVIVNRPFAEGALLRRLAERAVPAFAAAIGCRTWSQLLLKYVISHPAVTCVIPATASLDHVRENMAAASGPMPDEQMRRKIAEAAQR